MQWTFNPPTKVGGNDRPAEAGLLGAPEPSRNLNTLRLLLSVAALLALVTRALAQPALQYRFQAGQQYIYERKVVVTPLDGGAPARAYTEQVSAWCLRPKGHEMLVLLQLTGVSDGRAAPACGVLLYFDESGRRRIPDETAPRLGALDAALDLFPMLPLMVQQLSTWSTPTDLYGRQWRCTSRGTDGAAGQVRVDFTEEDASGVAELLGQSRSGYFRFDPVAGYLTHLEMQELDERARTRTAVVAVLRQTASHTPSWTARRAAEADQFLRTLRHEDRLLAEITNQPEDYAQTLDQLDRVWSTFASNVERHAASPFAALAEGRRQQWVADTELLRARAALARRWLNQPARPWSLQDAREQTVTSEATRHGAVIECFWSADSVWGLRALASLRRLPHEPGQPPLRVISYNMDFNLAAARRAMARCGEGLLHILGGPLQDVEELPEFPVVRVLDPHGVVRGGGVGWEPVYTAACEMARRLAR
jgi:hypothetical protein